MSWLERATAPLRRLRWAAARWSTDSDKAFHDKLFAARYDPFSFAYPGYLTIRRFADLAEERLTGTGTVFDLGCGPGEITCELARRMPGTRFVGIDHSNVAIERATEHARRLELTNVEFIASDLETFTPTAACDAILMFDAFHHLHDPAAFIRRMRPFTTRFVLIEPAGDWKGSWNRDFDLDWVTLSILRVRDRLEQQLGVRVSHPTTSQQPPPDVDEPTERRYAAGDFVRFFQPWPIEMSGTIAGLQEYGPQPFSSSEIRERIGHAIYRLIVDIERLLRDQDADLRAKHWVIYSAPDAAVRHAAAAEATADVSAEIPVQGAYDAGYSNYSGPFRGHAGQIFSAAIEVVNRGWDTWPNAGDSPVHVSYHWLDSRGQALAGEGLRNPFPAPVAPGSRRVVPLRIRCPETPGRHVLAIDLVREGVTWFSEAGVAPMRIAFKVTAS